MRDGRPVQVEGERGLLLSPIHASDVAGIVGRAATHGDAPGYDVVNVGGPEPLSVLDIAREIGSALGREPVIEHIDAQEPGGYVFASSRLEKTGWADGLPQPLTFAAGVRRALETSAKAGGASA